LVFLFEGLGAWLVLTLAGPGWTGRAARGKRGCHRV